MTKVRNLLFFLFFFVMLSPNNIIISQQIDDIAIIKNSAYTGYETGGGAYSYAYSPYMIGLSKATTYVHLPTAVNTNGGKRNAYISLGVGGAEGFIDLGLLNSGGGWFPCYNNNGTMKCFQDYTAGYEVKIIGIEVEIVSTRKVIFSISFRNSYLKILRSFSTNVDPKGVLVTENNKVKAKFYRFASLANVSTQPDDHWDHTFMINGIFTGLTIVVNGRGRPWGIDSDYVDVAWMYSPSRMEFSHNNDHESFSIKNYNYPN